MDAQRGTQKQIAKRYEDRVESEHTRTPWRRTRFLLSLLAIGGGLAGIFFAQQRAPTEFFNTGALSRQHSQLPNDCTSCHVPESLTKRTGGTRVFQVLNDRAVHGAPAFDRIDRACETCHQQHSFHEPNVLENRSCSACHMEHQGPGSMPAVASVNCAACHNDPSVMQASAHAGMQVPPARFHLNPKVADPRAVTPRLARPPEGYTIVFASFSGGHPAFQLQRENVSDKNVLRFNHQRHLNGRDIPPTAAGTRLDCTSCHQPESNGRYMKPVSFEVSCRQCHALQFDVNNPDFHLPHGDAQLVRTFLRTLPAQYGEFARRSRRLTSETNINEFVAQQIQQLRIQFRDAEALERAVFFASDPYKASQTRDPSSRANYSGCALCHEVKQAANVAYPSPEITKPVMVTRWMPHAVFDHAKHAVVSSCRDCHVAAQSSSRTSDVLMPNKESCATCHQPRGQARNASDCTTCHVYHGSDAVLPSVASTAGFWKQMLRGAAEKGETSQPEWLR